MAPKKVKPATDRVMELFGKIESDFPGRTEPVNRPEGAPVVEEADWHELGQVHLVGGEAVTMYPIGAVAAAFGRVPTTLRAWESSGKIPKTFLRTPPPERGLPGTQKKGRRLYSAEMIEGMIAIAQEEGCIVNGSPPTEIFTSRVEHLFARLRDEMAKK